MLWLFNVTVEQWRGLNADQGGVCALCEEPETKVHHLSGEVMRLAVDHDHACCPSRDLTCGTCIRGLLCYDCNVLLGKVELKVKVRVRFEDYLQRRPFADRAAR